MRLDWIFLPRENPCAKFYIIIIIIIIIIINNDNNNNNIIIKSLYSVLIKKTYVQCFT